MSITFALSIVIPIYNEERVLPTLFSELDRALKTYLQPSGPVELILVNDGSGDRSWELIVAQCEKNSHYVGISLSRNFGHQAAITAGLEACRGRMVVTMDADMQDPPDLIPEMIAAHLQGYDVVYATRVSRGDESRGKRITAAFFYWLMERIGGVRIPANTGDFRLLSRRALTELSKLHESHRFLRGLVPWIGFPQTQVFYNRGDRVAGNTHYSWPKMLLLAFDGIASMSRAPLRLAYATSLSLFAVFVIYILYVVLKHTFIGGTLVPGWTSIMCAITIFGTIQILLFGVFGEYLGRIYEQVKQRPVYIIKDIRHTNEPIECAPSATVQSKSARVSELVS